MQIKINHLFLLILAGVIIGVWSVFSAGTLTIFLVFFLITLYLYRTLPAEEKKYIILLFVVAFLLRAFFAALYYYSVVHVGKAPLFAQDGEQYSSRALYISLILRELSFDSFINLGIYGVDMPFCSEIFGGRLPRITDYQIGAFTYFISIIYAVFGYAPLVIRFINSLFCILTALIAYFTAKDIFNIKVAKATYFLTLFFPSLFLHSTSALKDPAFNFFLILLLFVLLRWSNHGFKKKYIMLVFLNLLFLHLLRPKSFSAIIISTLISTYIILIRQRRTKKMMVVISIFLFLYVILNLSKITAVFSVIKESAIKIHIGYVTTPGEVYKLLDDRYYSNSQLISQISGLELINYIVKGLFYSFFEPFPWKYLHGTKIVYSLQMIAWFILSPFFVLGLFNAIKYRLARIYPLLIFFFIIWFSLAITMGNPGTVFRFRDSIVPIFLMVSMAGYMSKKAYSNRDTGNRRYTELDEF